MRCGAGAGAGGLARWTCLVAALAVTSPGDGARADERESRTQLDDGNNGESERGARGGVQACRMAT